MKAIPLILLIATSSGFSQDKNLPFDSLDVLMNLQDFEKAQREIAEKAIANKRELVIKVLRTHLQRETKSGDLDAALAIKKTIESLETEGTSNPEQAAVPGDSLNLVGSRWIGGQGKGTKIQFLKDGKMLLTVPGANSPWEWTYRVVNDELYVTPNGQPEHKPTLSDDNNKLEIYMMGGFERQTKPD